jgi:CubicO group peptidase (beta-lactamase class C family)
MRRWAMTTVVTAVLGATGLGAQGPIPEIRARISAFVAGVNGTADAFEVMAQANFTSSMSPDDVSKVLDDYITPLVAADTFSGTVLVAKGGTRMFERAYGLADRAQRVANTMATRFNIGSINKAFTKTAIGQLVAQGKLALTDTVGARLPDYPNADAKPATISQLLEHRAGIADFFGDSFAAAPKDRFRSNAD